MRETHKVQSNIFDLCAQHDLGRELETISATVDRLSQLLSLIEDRLFIEETLEASELVCHRRERRDIPGKITTENHAGMIKDSI